MADKINVCGVELTREEARAFQRVITDPSFTSYYVPVLLRIFDANSKKILKHDPEKDGIHAEGVLRGRNLQILEETTRIRELITQQI